METLGKPKPWWASHHRVDATPKAPQGASRRDDKNDDDADAFDDEEEEEGGGVGRRRRRRTNMSVGTFTMSAGLWNRPFRHGGTVSDSAVGK